MLAQPVYFLGSSFQFLALGPLALLGALEYNLVQRLTN